MEMPHLTSLITMKVAIRLHATKSIILTMLNILKKMNQIMTLTLMRVMWSLFVEELSISEEVHQKPKEERPML